ncbi:Gly-X carboxypeptidase [Scheffersomyces xylosifermentans]|uniref:Gly-X carboxypeptidase n=1 Tax=Scheffersomyces xylosifermentans TaxID=1304137 RepID=UPI00315C8F39
MIGLPLDNNSSVSELWKKKTTAVAGAVVVLLVVLFGTNLFNYLRIEIAPIGNTESLCPLNEPIVPKSFLKDNSSVLTILHDKRYRKESIAKLSGAIQVDTQIFDNQPDVPDAPEVWAKFGKFHEYLEKTFPLVYQHISIEKVNTWALVYHWKGSDSKLKPLMLTAHQDTVPIQSDTLGDWTYPPLEGHYDGEYIYGRGSTDCKNVLISILETFEYMLKEGYKPQRSVIAAFGFDEESSGIVSATALAKYLEKTYGKDSMYAIIDEGPGLTIDSYTDTIVATPGTGEKGYVDIEVELTTPGGHSSIPPDHTSIGIMGELAYIIEKDPYSPILTSRNPTLSYMQCMALHDPKRNIPRFLKRSILRAAYDKFANSKVINLIQENKLTRYLIQTSQAQDIIKGGEKANALPENVKLLVNHRVAIESSVQEVKQHFISRVVEVAKRHNLAVNAYGDVVLDTKNNSGVFQIRVFSSPLDAAPLTPLNDNVWKYLSGVTRHVFEDLVYPEIDYPIISSPAIMTGNTDTRHYWNLTRNIFRYSPFFVRNLLHDTHAHSVDERLKFDAHLQLNAFFYEYIQAVDTVKADNDN